jgi:large subunit ribosomal protein L25
MKKIVLKAKTRVPKKAGDFSGWIKGVVYGPELKENKLVWVKVQDFNKAYSQAGRSTLVDLTIEDSNEEHSVLFHEMQRNNLTNDLTHIDFYKVKMGEKIETTIDLNFIDEAPAVKEHGAILVKGLYNLEVRCFPRHLVHSIDVSLQTLKDFEDSIYVEDIVVPKEIEVINNPDTVVVSLSRPRSEEEMEKLDEKVEMDVDQVEAEKGSKDDEAEEGEEKVNKEKEESVKENSEDKK